MARGEITGCKPSVTPIRSKRSGPPQRVKPKVKATDSKTTDSETADVADSETSESGAESEIEAAPQAESCTSDAVTRPRIRGPPTPPACYTIESFCRAHHISESFYFKLKNMGLGPREMHAGARILITFEAAADWRRDREVAAATAAE
jgi:hypothetical protein